MKTGVLLCSAALLCLCVADECSGMGVGREQLMGGRHRACQSYPCRCFWDPPHEMNTQAGDSATCCSVNP